MVYKVSSADVKMYQNKIRELIIEGEDFTDSWDQTAAWIVRYRSYARGGKDVMLKGYTNWQYEYDYYEGDSIIHGSSKPSVFTSDRSNDPVVSRSYNAYVRYEPLMYSTTYQIYWLAYDDYEAHTRLALNPDTITAALVSQQKMLISFPGKPVLYRDAEGAIRNNFSNTTCFATQDTAGILKERPLMRYRKLDANTASLPYLFVLQAPFTAEDQFGQGGTIKCPSYGKATLFVSNTTRDYALNANTNSRYPGLVFLDYIRLVPIVDPND
jgi:hypothetical protein